MRYAFRQKRGWPVNNRPSFLNDLRNAYKLRRRNVILLTGGIHDIFWSEKPGNFVSLEQLLYNELRDKFALIRMDVATGISFGDEDVEQEIFRVYESADDAHPKTRRDLKQLVETSKHNPLHSLVLLKKILDRFISARRVKKDVKPLCVVFQYAGSLFPPGEFARLSELDRQRLVFFLGVIGDPMFFGGDDLFILINPVKSEINNAITALPNAAHIEISLPDTKTREQFVTLFTNAHPSVQLEMGIGRFSGDTAGLKLTNIQDILEIALRSSAPVTKTAVVAEVNTILQAELGDIIRIKYPAHTSKDIVGYEQQREIFRGIFERCDDPETAVSAILVSGPNGGGKTFQLEAFAAESGRVVVELAGIRGSYFGETDKFFELLRWHIATFGKILILVDEAHTAFGSVHSGHTHETEKRLAGNVIKMMGDPRYFGKVLWGLMTSRPDELDPDIKSRSPIQIPVFDLQGGDRKCFVREMFVRKKIELNDSELDMLLRHTDYYSARDYRNLVAEVMAQRKKRSDVPVLEVLQGWRASTSIVEARELQTLIAAQHCSYPNLLPPELREVGEQEVSNRIRQLKMVLGY